MSLTAPITVEWTLNRRSAAKANPATTCLASQERIPRLARLMALAIKFDSLIRQGVVRDYADLALLGHVSRARITQIMNLLNLAPDIQEQLLDFCMKPSGRVPPCERHVRRLTRLIPWPDQRLLWRSILLSLKGGASK